MTSKDYSKPRKCAVISAYRPRPLTHPITLNRPLTFDLGVNACMAANSHGLPLCNLFRILYVQLMFITYDLLNSARIIIT